MALTDAKIKNARFRDKFYRLSDREGLFLWISPAGSKLWRWSYRFEGKEKLMSFGKYPVISLSKARELHFEAKRTFASGVDPMAKRKELKMSLRVAHTDSFANITAKWLEHWEYGKSPRHVAYVKRRLEVDILPVIGSRSISLIEAPDIVALSIKIENRGASDIAKRSFQTISQIFRYAIAHGFAKRNPAADIRPGDILKPTVRVNYSRIDAKILPEFLARIEVYQGLQITRLAMKLMALTFVRTSELIGAPWSEIDFENARWDIPAERMKMRTPHIVPLAKQTLELLELLKLITGGAEWLFPGDRNPKKTMSNNTILKAIERIGYKGRMTGHGFRGLASTILHEQGYIHDHIELQLAHSPRNAVSAAYNHALYLEPRAKMMQEWADYLDLAQQMRLAG